MGRIIWIGIEILIFLGGLPVLFGWMNVLMNPREMASGEGWSVPKAIGMQVLFTIIWFAIFSASYATALYLGVAD